MSYKVRMTGFLIRTGVRMLSLAGVLYFTFFVPLGPHTLYGHLSRIADTQEAAEFSRAVSASAAQAYDALKSRVARLGP
jgi:hypothetical protein